jgi:CheY-specific phosphatase CheX
MAEQLDFRRLMEAMTRRTEAFLAEELDIPAQARDKDIDQAHKIELKHLTSIMGVEGHFGVYLAFSFEEKLIRQALDAFADDVEIEEDERDLYLEEAATEILNTIVGNATADFNQTGPAIRLSPPIVVTEARKVLRHKGAQFFSTRLQTAYGVLDIHCIGPKELFDEQLNYISEEA